MNDITALAQRMKAAAEKATPGEWRAFTHPASGTYAIHTPKDKRCEDVIKWPGFDGRENAGANAKFVATANPANVLALVEALEKAQSELAKANGVLDKIKSTSCHVDTSEGAVIPGSLDAWGRPVPQHLPYDFSGNPSASATQYCNGWNDAGGYWLNYIRELESRTVTHVTYSENSDADRCRKWAWEQVKGELSPEGWTTGDYINYFGFFCWGWDMRRQYNEQRTAGISLKGA